MPIVQIIICVLCLELKTLKSPVHTDFRVNIFGGNMWESNPPGRLLTADTGFEDQEAHQHLYTPEGIIQQFVCDCNREFNHHPRQTHEKIRRQKTGHQP